MNREDRRQMRMGALKRLSKARSYVLVTFDEGIPIYSCEIGKCDDRHDTRHVFMREITESIRLGVRAIQDMAIRKIADLEQRGRVEEYKEKRSEELRGEVVDGQG
jgi:hypothetical protein